MESTATSRVRRIMSRIAATWDELDHAQRRLLEIQTGTTGLTRGRGSRPRGQDSQPGSERWPTSPR
jgi:hypothetical protein